MNTNSISSLHFARPVVSGTGIGVRRSARLTIGKIASLSLGLLCLGVSNAPASDPVGIYAIVDKVVLEPNATNSERIQVWGVFAIADGFGHTYRTAERGYLYYKLDPAKPDVSRNEWSDLKSVACTGQIVAFGARHSKNGGLRTKDARAENPDVYPVAMGLRKIRGEMDYEPLKQLARLRQEKPKPDDSAAESSN